MSSAALLMSDCNYTLRSDQATPDPKNHPVLKGKCPSCGQPISEAAKAREVGTLRERLAKLEDLIQGAREELNEYALNKKGRQRARSAGQMSAPCFSRHSSRRLRLADPSVPEQSQSRPGLLLAVCGTRRQQLRSSEQKRQGHHRAR